MKTLWYRLRWWFFETFGEHDIEETYLGHGNFREVCGWTFRGRFYPCDPRGERSDP